jgi:hypothetical protein
MTSSVSASGQTTVTFQTSYDPTAPATRVFNLEITSEAQAYYIAQMSMLQHALLDGVATDANGNVLLDTSGNPVTLTSSEITSIVNSVIKTLDSWSQMVYVATSGSQVTDSTKCSFLSTASTMTRYMASDLDTLERTLAAAGVSPLSMSSPPTTAELDAEIAAIQTIKSDDTSSSPIYGVRTLIASALKDASNALIIGTSNTQSTSIQQLLMVDYIATGNEVLYGQMTNLQNAINLNQNVLSYLNSLQDLMNQKTASQFLMQLSSLNSSSPDYTKFESETFGEQVIGTTADFTDADLQKYIALLATKNSGIDLDTDMLASIQYGFGGPVTDLQRLSLFEEITTTNNSTGAVIVPLTSTSIPADAISGYTPTAYDQQLFAKYVTAVNSGADVSDPAVQLKYGLVDFSTAVDETLANNSSLTEAVLFNSSNPTGVAAMANLLGIQTSQVSNELSSYLHEIYGGSQYNLTSIDTNVEVAASVIKMFYSGVHPNPDPQSEFQNLFPAGIPDSLSALATFGHAVYQGCVSGTLNQTMATSFASDPTTLWNALSGMGLVNAKVTPTYSALLGDNSVEVLINLQKAGLMNDDGTIPATTISTYNLTAQDVADYALIYQIQQTGLDPTDSTVQTQYGLTVRNDNLSANVAVGTSPAAFVNVISGQYNGSSGVQAIIDNLTALIALAKSQIGGTSASSIVSELSTVLDDFQGIVDSGASDPIATWVTNFSNNTEGTYQTNLNNAVVASQALNDTQRENLQQVMFVYQQFYQSATSMLSSIMTLMQTIASNISAA